MIFRIMWAMLHYPLSDLPDSIMFDGAKSLYSVPIAEDLRNLWWLRREREEVWDQKRVGEMCIRGVEEMLTVRCVVGYRIAIWRLGLFSLQITRGILATWCELDSSHYCPLLRNEIAPYSALISVLLPLYYTTNTTSCSHIPFLQQISPGAILMQRRLWSSKTYSLDYTSWLGYSKIIAYIATWNSLTLVLIVARCGC